MNRKVKKGFRDALQMKRIITTMISKLVIFRIPFWVLLCIKSCSIYRGHNREEIDEVAIIMILGSRSTIGKLKQNKKMENNRASKLEGIPLNRWHWHRNFDEGRKEVLHIFQEREFLADPQRPYGGNIYIFWFKWNGISKRKLGQCWRGRPRTDPI